MKACSSGLKDVAAITRVCSQGYGLGIGFGGFCGRGTSDSIKLRTAYLALYAGGDGFVEDCGTELWPLRLGCEAER